MQIKALVLSPSMTLKDAIRLMDDEGYGVLPIVDDTNMFIGLLTDGDIRRAILNDITQLSEVINSDAMTMHVESSVQQRKQFLKHHHRRHLPIVDSNGHYMQMFIMDELDFNTKPNAVVIMAGGLGTRLGDLTKETPKPMLKVGRKPMLQTILEMYIEQGFETFYFSVNYKKEQIIDYFGNGEKWGVNIKYLVEDERLGTGGALSLIEDDVRHPLLVTNADVFSSIDYEHLIQQHKESKAVATMCTREHQYTVPYGVVNTEKTKIVSLDEKPTYTHLINAGVYLINPEALVYIPKKTFFDMPTLFEILVDKGLVCSTYTIDGHWVDIGLIEEYENIREKFGY